MCQYFCSVTLNLQINIVEMRLQLCWGILSSRIIFLLVHIYFYVLQEHLYFASYKVLFLIMLASKWFIFFIAIIINKIFLFILSSTYYLCIWMLRSFVTFIILIGYGQSPMTKVQKLHTLCSPVSRLLKQQLSQESLGECLG